ncbi:uncharacterized protein LOC102802228 [Saccoglossus kowalevskii]
MLALWKHKIYALLTDNMAAVSPKSESLPSVQGIVIHGTVAAGPHSMNSRIYLTEEQLTVNVLSKIFCLDASTIKLRERNGDIDAVYPISGGGFPMERLVSKPDVEWVCDGEPDKKNFGYNGYTTVKTVAVGVLNFSLFVSHLSILFIVTVILKCNASASLVVTIIIVVVCMVFELIIFFICFVIGMFDIDSGQGQDSVIILSSCLRKLQQARLRSWNKSCTLCCFFLFLGNVVLTLCFPIMLSQSGNCTMST